MKAWLFQVARECVFHTLRVVLRWAVRWQPIAKPEPGYSIIIGASAPLSPMLAGNLLTLDRQQRDNLREIIVVFDRQRGSLPDSFEADLRKRFPRLPLTFLYYTAFQDRIAQRASLPGVYAWMSWAIAIAQVRTQYVFVQDFDAIVLNPQFIEQRFKLIREKQVHWLGIQHYRWGNVPANDEFVQTFELIFDAEFVRRRFVPVDLFDRIRTHQGRKVHFDTCLDAQSRDGRRDMVPALSDDLVHPGQVISQFTRLMRYPRYVPPEKNNLFWIPYFIHLGGDSSVLTQLTRSLQQTKDRSVPFFGKRMDLRELSPAHAQRIRSEMSVVEQHLFGSVRPELEELFDALHQLTSGKAQPATAAQR